MSEKFFRCPKCGGMGNLDDDQWAGQVSVICPECGWHGYCNEDGNTRDA